MVETVAEMVGEGEEKVAEMAAETVVVREVETVVEWVEGMAVAMAGRRRWRRRRW